jgi:hypothetical protein
VDKMALYARDNGGEDFEPMEMGLQQAVCSHVIDLNIQTSEMYGDKHQVAICFELSQKMKDGRPFMISKIYTLSIGKKANLRKDLETWRGKPYGEEDLKGIDVEKLIGVNCYLNIMPHEKDGKVYGKISGINRLPKEFQQIKPIGQTAPEWLVEKAAKGKKPEEERDQGLTGKISYLDLMKKISEITEVSQVAAMTKYVAEHGKDYEPTLELPELLEALTAIRKKIEAGQNDLPF